MLNIPTMPCGDGIRRACNSAFHGLTEPSNAAPSGEQAKIASYTLKQQESGQAFSNRGASGPITFTLPAWKFGLWFTIYKIEPTRNILLSGAIDGFTTITNSTNERGSITVVAIGNNQWAIQAARGTWAGS